jgi:hypothetical protein
MSGRQLESTQRAGANLKRSPAMPAEMAHSGMLHMLDRVGGLAINSCLQGHVAISHPWDFSSMLAPTFCNDSSATEPGWPKR